MRVSLDEIRQLRKVLINQRLEHELLATKMQVLNRAFDELREQTEPRLKHASGQ